MLVNLSGRGDKDVQTVEKHCRGAAIVSRSQRPSRGSRASTSGLVTYTTAGDPDLARSAEILQALDRAGADVLEVGVPFSDPLADGPVIQRATERALAAGGSLRGVLGADRGGAVAAIAAPIVVFSYANPMLRMGVEAFARAGGERRRGRRPRARSADRGGGRVS